MKTRHALGKCSLVVLGLLILAAPAIGQKIQWQMFRDRNTQPTNSACNLIGCSPRSLTYGFYHESWRRWPEVQPPSKYDLQPFVVPDRTIPANEVPPATDETAIIRRKRESLDRQDGPTSKPELPDQDDTSGDIFDDFPAVLPETTEETLPPDDSAPDDGGLDLLDDDDGPSTSIFPEFQDTPADIPGRATESDENSLPDSLDLPNGDDAPFDLDSLDSRNMRHQTRSYQFGQHQDRRRSHVRTSYDAPASARSVRPLQRVESTSLKSRRKNPLRRSSVRQPAQRLVPQKPNAQPQPAVSQIAETSHPDEPREKLRKDRRINPLRR